MSHELSETSQNQGNDLWYNTSNVVWPRVLQGPFLHQDVAESAARRRSQTTDPWQLYAPLSPLGASPPSPLGLSPSGPNQLGLASPDIPMEHMLQLLNMRGPVYPSLDRMGEMNWSPLDYLQERVYSDMYNQRPPIPAQTPPKPPTPAEIEKAREQDLQSSAQRNRQLLVAIRKYRRAS